MRELALFAGAGGGILGGRLLGWRTKCAVELDAYARNVLLSRQRDGQLEPFPIWDDIRTFDGGPWRETIDVVSGGFPCQDISAAGKGGGLAGRRSGLWFEMLRVIEEIKPRFVFAENSPHLRVRGLGTVIEGLTALGYDVRWCVLGAWHIGAPHKRNRMWILAHADSQSVLGQKPEPRQRRKKNEGSADLERNGKKRSLFGSSYSGSSFWGLEPDVGRVADGVAHRVDRLRAIGNGQVPRVAAEAFTILSDGWM